jgi:Tfp pilus assembly protein PilF
MSPRLFLVVAAVAAFTAQTPARPSVVREDAYRASNVGVALLEQFNYSAAADKFRDALRIDPGLALARVNLAIALLYAPDLDGAEREATEAARLLSNDPHPPYVLGLAQRARGGREAQARTAFERVLQIDPHDVGAQINLGQLDLQQQRYDAAVEHFRAALAEEPFSVTAMYNLGLALTRAGRRDEGLKAMERSQAMRAGGYGIIFSANYLEQGRYAEAIASTGAEPDLVDRTTPNLTYAPAPLAAGLQPSADPAVTLIDYDGDFDVLVVSPSGGLRLLRNDGRTFVDVTAAAGLAPDAVAGSVGAVAGDYDNDGRDDVLLLRKGGGILYHNNGKGTFSRASAAALPPFAGVPASAALVDFDHDGDLDVVIGGDAPLQMIRNNGNGTFTDITAQSGVGTISGVVAIVPTDYDNHRDVDLLVVRRDGPPALFRNLRDGTFRDVAAEVGLRVEGRIVSVAAADVNKDDFPDFFFGRAGAPGVFALSDGRGRFTISAAPAASADATAAQLLDYDNDGLVDLLTWSASGPHLLRNVGGSWNDVTSTAFPTSTGSRLPAIASARALATADLHGDGGTDLIVGETTGAVNVWRSSGQARHPAVRVRLTGRASNRDGVGSKIDIRAGSLRQRIETAAAMPSFRPADVRFGLGSRSRADVVRVLWPSGILQAETSVTSPLIITELDRKPSSCPFLYTWNGRRFEFITDFMGGGEMGYWEAPGRRNVPDSDEYVRIEGDRLAPKNGRYELRVTNELEEAVFLDRVQLVAVSHPADIEVFPNEGMTDPPKPFRLFAVRGLAPPARAVDDHGHDVTARIAKRDRVYPDDFELSAFRGYAMAHTLTLTLTATGPGSCSSRDLSPTRVLLLTGWTDYAFSSDNVAAHQAGLSLQPPRLEIKDDRGNWRTKVEDIGIPVGRPQTIPIELDASVCDVRIVTNMRIYWDQILVGTTASLDGITVDRLEPASAALRWRGFSAEVPDGREPATYDYDLVTSESPWKVMPGHYTAEGDVLPLVAAVDDRFVVSRPGDEVAVSFDASRTSPLQSGWKQTFLLFADGFSKEMDVNSASPDRVEPLPFHGMTKYPYSWPEHYPGTGIFEEYRSRYNTRIVAAPVPSIDQPRKHADTK